MPKNQFVDFKAVKAAVEMEEVLQHYGLLDRFMKGSVNSIDSGEKPPTLFFGSGSATRIEFCENPAVG